MLISIAIPCYRSEKNLPVVIDEIRGEFRQREGYDYQIILVCDGSPDHTDHVIRELCEKDQKITGILLSRNFTQNNAKMAALPYAKGDILVYMDDDGQHPAADIFRLAEKVLEGYDVVYARFTEKKQSGFKKLTSRWNNTVREKLGTKPKGIEITSFVAYSRFAIDELQAYKSPTPTHVGFLNGITTKFANIDCSQRKRISGKTGYTLSKLLSMAVTGYTNFTIVPLRIIDLIGSLFAFGGLIYGIILIIRKLFFASVVPGYTSNMVVLLILGGLILVSLGLVGEYVGRIYILLSNKPQFVVREAINADCEKQ